MVLVVAFQDDDDDDDEKIHTTKTLEDNQGLNVAYSPLFLPLTIL